jgi:hypothetical protein
MRVSRCAVAVVVLSLLTGCDLFAQSGGDGPAGADAVRASPFRWCRAGPQGGGYHIRAVGISCAKVAKTIHRLGLFRTTRALARRTQRDPDAGLRRVTEVVWRTTGGWTCLAQPVPRNQVTQFLCVRGRQVLLYRVS